MAPASSNGGPPKEGQATKQSPCIPFNLNVPPVECCICYGSSFFPQLQRTGAPQGPPSPGPPVRPDGGPSQQQQQPGGPIGAPSRQGGDTSSSRGGSPMGDLLLLVPQQQLLQWHRDNLKANLHHYSSVFEFASLLGGLQTAAEAALLLTKASGVHILFNCRVPTGLDSPKLCKYGVAPTESVFEDLNKWTHIYFAGRMQKPVSINWCGDSRRREEFEAALNTNRRNALRLALLLLPDGVSLECLLKEIVSLSYKGDFRVPFAEDPNKVQAIVNGQGPSLCSIYLPLLSEISSVHLEVEGGGPLGTGGPLGALGGPPLLQRLVNPAHVEGGGPTDIRDKASPIDVELRRIRIRQDRSPAALAALYDPLPLSVRQRAEAVFHRPLRSSSGFFCGVSGGPPVALNKTGGPHVKPPPPSALQRGLQQLMFGPTLKCSLKNAVSAGLGASVLYSLHKLGKRLGLR